MRWALVRAVVLSGLLSAACTGGMDGAGSTGLGLSWNRRVAVQPLWEGGKLSYLVVNQRTSAVEVSVHNEGGQQLITRWQVPANSTRAFDGAPLLDREGLALFRLDGEHWGLLEPPTPPELAAELPVVSNEGMNGDGKFQSVQIETAFSVASGSMFHAEIVLPVPGELSIETQTENEYAEFLEVVNVRSASATVTTTNSGFLVLLPNETSPANPARVALDLALPKGFGGGQLAVLDAGFFTGTGSGYVRAVPLAPQSGSSQPSKQKPSAFRY